MRPRAAHHRGRGVSFHSAFLIISPSWNQQTIDVQHSDTETPRAVRVALTSPDMLLAARSNYATKFVERFDRSRWGTPQRAAPG
jgi:hypothetical protein